MNLEFCSLRETKCNTAIATAIAAMKRLFAMEEESLPDADMDEGSNGQSVKKPLRCSISGCFDKYNICCKACDIKKCRYKCNFLDKEVCEHQFI